MDDYQIFYASDLYYICLKHDVIFSHIKKNKNQGRPPEF